MDEVLIRPLAELVDGQRSQVAVAILSLPNCIDRRQVLLHRGLPAAWVVRHWPGADLRGQPPWRYRRFLDVAALQRRYRRPWRSSEAGCALSHRSALLAFLATPAQFLVVLEDDIIPTIPQVEEALTQLILPLLEARPQALFCHLGPRPEHLDPADLRPLRQRRQGHPPAISLTLKLQQNRNRPLWRAHAYLISRETARHCLALEPDGLAFLADDWQARRQLGALGLVLVADPPLFLQDDVIPSTQQDPIPCVVSSPPRQPWQRLQRQLNAHILALSDRFLRRVPYSLR